MQQHRLRCEYCGNGFVSKRNDAHFCSDRCAAAWARNAGYHREDIHAPKDEWINKNCEWCQTIFSYNEYAMRGGERVPKFCSNRCRQAAYRERKKQEGQPAGYTGNWDDARNDKTYKGTSQGGGSGASQGGKKTWSAGGKTYGFGTDKGTQQESGKGTSQHTANKGTQQPPMDERWKSRDAHFILGVTYLTTMEEIKKAWKKLLRTYHPDISKDPNAEKICKKINWAWDRIENAGSRTNRR